MKTTTLRSKDSANRFPRQFALLFIPLALACFALAPTARAVCQEGCDTSNNNTFLGDDALISNTTGVYNTAVGSAALLSNTDGSQNTATGVSALTNNGTGFANTANGYSALQQNTTGSGNTANGFNTLLSNTTGSDNTATGDSALYFNTIGSNNTAIGNQALHSNTTVSNNTATGAFALSNNTIGSDNTASGAGALFSNTTGANNTAIGVDVLYDNTAGRENTAIGLGALSVNKTGSSNTAIGMGALGNNITGNNIAIGESAGVNLTTGSGNIDIGNIGVAAEARTIRIGKAGTQRKTFIAGISGATVASGVGVIVGSNGQLGTVVSSERFKNDVKPMDEASQAILALKPVTFRYKHELDPDGIPQFGLVAEQVEKVNPDLVARDEQGKPYTVRYEAVNAMLLNEFLKEHRTVQEQKATIAQLKAAVAKQEATTAHQQKQIEALTTGLQKVSAQLELSKATPQTVLNDQ